MTTSGITNINAKLIHQHPDNPRKDLGDLTDACPKNITVSSKRFYPESLEEICFSWILRRKQESSI